MASTSQPRIQTFKATAAMAAFKAVKAGADKMHTAVAALPADKIIGIAQSAPAAAEDPVEVAINGGGAKALLGGTVAFGDFLTTNADGKFIVATGLAGGDRVVAIAMQAGVLNDVIAVEVSIGSVQ